MSQSNIFTPEQYGADPSDPLINDTPCIQMAVDAAGLVGGTVEFGPYTYDITETILQTRSCRVVGSGWGNVNLGAWPSDTVSTIRAIATFDGEAIWKIQADTPGETIHNPSMDRICLNGNFLAGIGLVSSSTSGQYIGDLHVRHCTDTGLRIDDANGVVCKYGVIKSYRYRATAQEESQDSNGLVMDSTGVGQGGLTQWNVGELIVTSGINGEGFILGDCDSSYFARVQGSSIRLKGTENRVPEGLRASRKNTFSHLAADVYAETGSITTVHSINSEPARRVILERNALFHYDNLLNRTTGANYQTRRFSMNRPTVLGVRDSSRNLSSSKLPEVVYRGVQGAEALRLPTNDSDKQASWTFNPADDYDDGALTGVVIRYFEDPSNTSPIVLKFVIKTMSTGQFAGSPDFDEEFSIPVTNVQKPIYKMAYFPFSRDLLINRHDVTIVNVNRPDDVANAGDFDLIGLELQYAAEGPIDGPNQQYDAPVKMICDPYMFDPALDISCDDPNSPPST